MRYNALVILREGSKPKRKGVEGEGQREKRVERTVKLNSKGG
mgnify:CR=1 FL=1